METKYFIESNGSQYGPADVDQLIQWISEGRIAPDTMLVDAATTERTAAAMHPELGSWFSVAPPPPIPPQPLYPPPPPPQQGQYGAGGYAPPGGQQQAYRPPTGAHGYYGNAPIPSLGAGQYAGQNNSGTGAIAQLPAQAQGLNWGGFFMTPLWAIANNSPLALLCLIPSLGWVMSLIVLFKGNEWAWQNRRFESVTQFQAVQRAWAAWGVGITLVCTLFLLLLFALAGANP